MNTSVNSNTIADDKNGSVSRDNLNDGTCKRVYVSNLPYDFGLEELTSLFSEVGTVDFAKIINDQNNISMGIVDFNDQGGADKAFQRMNGHNINGSELLVKLCDGDDCDRHGRVVRGSCGGGSDDNTKGRQMRNSLVNLFYYRKILTSLFWWNSSNSLPGFFHTHCDAR